MSRTLVYSCGGGRLGNQLLNYAHLLAFSLEHPEFDVLDLAFLPYVSEYGNDDLTLTSIENTELPWAWRRFIQTFWGDSPLEPTFSTYPVNRFRLQGLHGAAHHRSTAQSIVGGDTHVYFHLPGDHHEQFDLNDSTAVRQLEKSELSVLAGWGVRAWPLVKKHRSTIQDRLLPGREHRSVATSYVSSLRDEFDHLAGVLIRQGDYRTHLDGKYFFESSRYREILDAYAKDHSAEDVGFLIASDEEQSRNIFDNPEFNFATGEAVGPNSYVENFAELMQCDVVITPPSTFSILSAFIGDISIVPLYRNVLDGEWEYLDNPLFNSRTHFDWQSNIEY
jgi:hypothetical protein